MHLADVHIWSIYVACKLCTRLKVVVYLVISHFEKPFMCWINVVFYKPSTSFFKRWVNEYLNCCGNMKLSRTKVKECLNPPLKQTNFRIYNNYFTQSIKHEISLLYKSLQNHLFAFSPYTYHYIFIPMQ